jgi:hypothetical protein
MKEKVTLSPSRNQPAKKMAGVRGAANQTGTSLIEVPLFPLLRHIQIRDRALEGLGGHGYGFG